MRIEILVSGHAHGKDYIYGKGQLAPVQFDYLKAKIASEITRALLSLDLAPGADFEVKIVEK